MLLDDNVGDVGRITSVQTRSLDTTPAGSDVEINADQDNNVTAVCFRAGTLIVGANGLKTVEALQPGDRVQTMDHGFQPVVWTGGLHISARQMREQPTLRPIRIEAGALGSGLPWRALEVSPQHRVLVRSLVAQRMFGVSEILVPAIKLLRIDGVDWMEPVDTHYVHVMLPAHEIMFANGAAAESLFLGRGTQEAMRSSLSFRMALRKARDAEIPARQIVERGADVDHMLCRIVKNRKTLIDVTA